MTKKEIVKTISDESGLTQQKTKEIVQKTFDSIIETLVSEQRIELRNFGVFEVKKRAARKARNPKTGDKVHVPAKFVVTFKPGKVMERRVEQMEREEARREQQRAAAERGGNLADGESRRPADAANSGQHSLDTRAGESTGKAHSRPQPTHGPIH